MAEIVWTEPALDDLRQIIDFIAQDSPIYAERTGIQLVEVDTKDRQQLSLSNLPSCFPEFALLYLPRFLACFRLRSGAMADILADKYPWRIVSDIACQSSFRRGLPGIA